MNLFTWIGTFMACSSIFWISYALWINRNCSYKVPSEDDLDIERTPITLTEETEDALAFHYQAKPTGEVALKNKAITSHFTKADSFSLN